MSLTLSRPKKIHHPDTALYEIYMLRFAAGRLLEGQTKGYWRDEKDAWVYLEAFLVHFRNLIEFLGKEKPGGTDVSVKTIWETMNLVPPNDLEKLHAKGIELLKRYEPKGDNVSRISQYLAHCTTKRIEPIDWYIDTMTEEIEPLLTEIEKHLPPPNEILKREPPVRFESRFPASATVATITANVMLMPPGRKKFE
jgi:hypothetical protein